MGLFWDHCCFSFFINDIDKGKASLVALNRRPILGLIFTTLSRDLARFNVINWQVSDRGVI